MRTTARSWTSIISANPDRSANWASGVPSTEMRGGAPEGRRHARRLVHRWGQPLRHSGQVPQNIDVHATTWSPGFTVRTSEPTASTMPAGSWPGTVGTGPAIDPCMKWRSLWHTPHATVRMRTSSGAGSSTSMSSKLRPPPISRNTAALALVIGPPVGSARPAGILAEDGVAGGALECGHP